MKRMLTSLLIAMASLLLLGTSASAHVFIGADSGNSGVIMHVTPDDDPIAGAEANFYFDIQDSALNTNTRYYRLFIIDADEAEVQAATYVRGEQTLAASYVFPTQGVYTLRLAAYPIHDANNPDAASDPVIFTYNQRVSRGIVSSPQDAPSHVWAEFGIIAGLSALIVVMIVVISRYKLILQYTINNNGGKK